MQCGVPILLNNLTTLYNNQHIPSSLKQSIEDLRGSDINCKFTDKKNWLSLKCLVFQLFYIFII